MSTFLCDNNFYSVSSVQGTKLLVDVRMKHIETALHNLISDTSADTDDSLKVCDNI